MDGMELARRIRETRDIPFIIYTGRGSEEVAEAAFAVGVDDYVRKEMDPSHYQMLVKRIRMAVYKHRVEERLKETEDKLGRLIEYAPDAIYANDLNGVFLDGNKQAEELTGYRREELLGKSMLEVGLLPEECLPQALEAFEKNMRGERSEPDEFILKKKDGSRVTVEISSFPVKRAGKVEVIGIARDITERKQVEEKLLEYADHLEDMVEERTKELLDAERMVAVGRIASMVGHDLRGPLQNIKSATYLLRKVPERAGEAVEMIERAVDRAGCMLEELRNNTREAPIQLAVANLSVLVQRSQEEASPLATIDVSLELGEGLEKVNVDPAKVRRMLDNLIRNALEAMPDGGSLHIEAERRGDDVIIKVSDTGVGIKDEDMPKLFKPFHTTKPRGMGLGLAYCKQVVEAHGGIITAESKVGEGTTFIIRIPHRHG